MDAEQLDSTLCNLYSLSHQQEIKLISELQNCFNTFMRYRKYLSYVINICYLNKDMLYCLVFHRLHLLNVVMKLI